MRGDPTSAVKQLMLEGRSAPGKLIETAYQVLQRYPGQGARCPEDPRHRGGAAHPVSTGPTRSGKPERKRQAGGLQLRASG